MVFSTRIQRCLRNLGELLLGHNSFAACEPSLEGRRIAVVGAGASGLYAAYLLQKMGADVIVLEALERPGGRIHAIAGFAESPIELGASFVHGSRNVLHGLAKRTGVRLAPARGDDFVVMDGRLERATDLASDPDLATYLELVQGALRYCGPELTLDGYFRQRTFPPRIDHLLGDVGVSLCASNDRIEMTEFVRLAATIEASYEASENLLPNRPYLSMFDGILADLASHIEYGAPIEHIDHTGATIFLKDAKGRNHEAERVIVTVPLGVLQRGTVRFSPELPSLKREAIRGLAFGAGMKVALKFSARYWPDDLGVLSGTAAATNFWPAVGGARGEHVLLAYVTGAKAEWLGRRGDQIVPTLLQELDGLFGAGRASDTAIGAHVMNWTADPFFGGIFAYPLSGWRAMKEALAAPVGDRVFFAGEATHLGKHPEGDPGTVHGAIVSGERAAREVAATLKSA